MCVINCGLLCRSARKIRQSKWELATKCYVICHAMCFSDSPPHHFFYLCSPLLHYFLFLPISLLAPLWVFPPQQQLVMTTLQESQWTSLLKSPPIMHCILLCFTYGLPCNTWGVSQTKWAHYICPILKTALSHYPLKPRSMVLKRTQLSKQVLKMGLLHLGNNLWWSQGREIPFFN